jgi:hypothetical protein
VPPLVLVDLCVSITPWSRHPASGACTHGNDAQLPSSVTLVKLIYSTSGLSTIAQPAWLASSSYAPPPPPGELIDNGGASRSSSIPGRLFESTISAWTPQPSQNPTASRSPPKTHFVLLMLCPPFNDQSPPTPILTLCTLCSMVLTRFCWFPSRRCIVPALHLASPLDYP